MIGGTYYVGASLFLAAAVSGPPGVDDAAVARLFERVMVREPFVGSGPWQQDKETQGRFFGRDDYRVLRGNPVIGYWDVGSFRWVGRAISWGGMTSVGTCAPITTKAWDAAMDYSAKKRGLALERGRGAPIRIFGGCVAAELGGDGATPGVLVEVKVESPTGTLRYRLAEGKGTVEEAIGATVDFVVGFAEATARDFGKAKK